MPDQSATERFAAAMEAVGPFEPAPQIAVAVSGGADSMALCLLADRWARDRGGAVLALTVDHRLRPESAAEAAQVGRWLRARGIDHVVLTRRDEAAQLVEEYPLSRREAYRIATET